MVAPVQQGAAVAHFGFVGRNQPALRVVLGVAVDFFLQMGEQHFVFLFHRLAGIIAIDQAKQLSTGVERADMLKRAGDHIGVFGDAQRVERGGDDAVVKLANQPGRVFRQHGRAIANHHFGVAIIPGLGLLPLRMAKHGDGGAGLVFHQRRHKQAGFAVGVVRVGAKQLVQVLVGVEVQQDHIVAHQGKRAGQMRGGGGFAHAALAGEHADIAAIGRRLAGFGLQRGAQQAAIAVFHQFHRLGAARAGRARRGLGGGRRSGGGGLPGFLHFALIGLDIQQGVFRKPAGRHKHPVSKPIRQR